jgi:hypothetical protein
VGPIFVHPIRFPPDLRNDSAKEGVDITPCKLFRISGQGVRTRWRVGKSHRRAYWERLKFERTITMNEALVNFFQQTIRRRRALALTCVLAASTAFLPAADEMHHAHGDRNYSAPAKLVQIVREATQRYLDVNMTAGAGYKPMFGCVSGPEQGAMGVHYINGGLVGDGEIDANHPEALIYEPTDRGMRLVGVEYIVDAATWNKTHQAPPVLEGQAFQYVSSPNRYGLPGFYELHVWAWRDNPNGAFVDWNTRVSCEGPQQ